MRGELSSHAFCSAVLYVRLEATVDDSLFFTTPLLEWTTLRRRARCDTRRVRRLGGNSDLCADCAAERQGRAERAICPIYVCDEPDLEPADD